jgi:hypothetical protein
MRYVLYEQGPNNRDTYAECWGTQATSPGRPRASSERLVEMIPHVNDLEHRNWIIWDRYRREIIDYRDFWKRPAVKRAIPPAE